MINYLPLRLSRFKLWSWVSKTNRRIKKIIMMSDWSGAAQCTRRRSERSSRRSLRRVSCRLNCITHLLSHSQSILRYMSTRKHCLIRPRHAMSSWSAQALPGSHRSPPAVHNNLVVVKLKPQQTSYTQLTH